MTTIKLAESIPDIEKCYPVLSQLHPYILEKDFVGLVQQQHQQNGYQLVYIAIAHVVKAVAGFHFGESFGWRKYLYVDDLVTDKASRSQGYGGELFSWLVEYAQQNFCVQLHLDSRVTRYSAHKFYLNQGMIIGGYHFVRELSS